MNCAWCDRELPPAKHRGRPRQFCRDHCRLRAWRWLQPTEDRLSGGDRWDMRLQRWCRTDRSTVERIFRRGASFRYQAPAARHLTIRLG